MKILFVCRGNVGRSQIAQALYEKYSGDKAYSAGIEVSKIGEKLKDKESAKDMILAMRSEGIDISENTRTKLTPDMIKDYDKIVVLAEETVIPDYLKKSKNAVFFNVEDKKDKGLKEQKELIADIKTLIKGFIKGNIKNL